MEQPARCTMCCKEIPVGEGYYDTPEGPVCTDCHDKSVKADIDVTMSR